MSYHHEPFIPPEKKLPEITIKVIILSILLASLLAASNVYLALKIGVLTSASIPAAIISMGILRFFKNSNILENNLVQTAGSAGQAIAGGICYMIPALIIIHYWTHFDYRENFLIALLGGLLGVLFSIPFRKILVTQPSLHFPEGRAIAEVLLAGTKKARDFKDIILGGVLGSGLELAQTGFKIIASQIQVWFSFKNIVFGFGAGFSPALIGAGYLIGIELGISLLVGATLGWLIGVPVLSSMITYPNAENTASTVMYLWENYIRFIGLGAMLIGTLLPLFILFKLLIQGMFHFLITNETKNIIKINNLRTEKDIQFKFIFIGILVIIGILYFIFQHANYFAELQLSSSNKTKFILIILTYICFTGLIVAAITGYFSGLLGVAATPGSAILVFVLLTAALLINQGLHFFSTFPLSTQQALSATAIIIILGTIVGGSAAVAIDNIQDLKVGYILGATPWKQQVMLMIGVLCAAAITPLVMELLFQVYGIANVFPHPSMDTNYSLPAPPAALMATISQGFFNHHVPWHLINIGIGIGVFFILLQPLFKYFNLNLSPIGVAIGIYLPLNSSMALVIGGAISWFIKRKLYQTAQKQHISEEEIEARQEHGTILACGLVAGAALMNVALAVPFAITHNADIIAIFPNQFLAIKNIVGILSILFLIFLFYKITFKKN